MHSKPGAQGLAIVCEFAKDLKQSLRALCKPCWRVVFVHLLWRVSTIFSVLSLEDGSQCLSISFGGWFSHWIKVGSLWRVVPSISLLALEGGPHELSTSFRV